MKKILIIGAGVLQLPAIQKAKGLGLQVAVVDMDCNAPGILYADCYFEVSTNDVANILSVAEIFRPDAVMTLATDMPMRSVAAVAEKFGLHAISPDVAVRATDKIEMIRCFETYKIPHPWFEVITSEKELDTLLVKHLPPFIMKPNDASGSRGVILVDDIQEVRGAFLYSKSISKSGFVLIEEYMQGPEVSVEVMTIKGQTTVLAVTDKLTTGAPFFVEMGHSQPSVLSNEIIEKVKDIAIKAVQAIGIDNSPSHVEIIVTEDGPKLVEIGARLGGDCITTYLIPLSIGVDMVTACILLALGQEPDILPKYQKGAAIRYVKCKKGILQDIIGLDKAMSDPNIKHIEIVKKVGDKIIPVHSSGDRVGYVIAQATTPLEAIRASEKALNEIKFEVKEE
ncbi:ATP-grasp domain-containing protein [Butyricimonas virosa]|uniref:ATP-grasp domain-containing protein n=1 Tax=Butyricimonas virosa TaxID=544645 RepID=A0A413IJ37_9BACT|nr:ATP-grasp domain-containing protein [Butyricimonas virosa]RGY13011.1 ATP-grasp domain-containing protein [Butyricimonas virosa]RHI17320.1 ATP-grasp domain-containing protein [Butyricimonas virosa]